MPGVSGLDDTDHIQALLFDQEQRLRQSWLDAVANQIKKHLGAGTVRQGRKILRKRKLRFS